MNTTFTKSVARRPRIGNKLEQGGRGAGGQGSRGAGEQGSMRAGKLWFITSEDRV
ncbi:protein of unknown function [Candidatus Promineifilum breve]|uniref:Uncharacterized protein n=1 Tax=Candidatus Promineifilum breve TaxID=1806508 RepID=A0A160T5R8_9CHLR|nr:protein of unknown function [Candidatus Promineifilum breve]